MTRKCLVLVAFAMFTGSAVLSGGDDKDAVAAAFKKLQGSWKFTAHVQDGKDLPPEKLEKMKITFTDRKFSVTVDGKVVQAGTQKLDPAKKPAHVDATIMEG